MAGPLQDLLQGLQQRRQRRQAGWGGGDSPSMRDMINPLDSQNMSDRAQGVDISSAMPATRLEARMAPAEDPQPTGGAAVTAQLTGSRPKIRTAAGSNAEAAPASQASQPQYFDTPATCTGPNCGGNVISERVTHINGVPVGSATTTVGQPANAQASAAPASGPNPAEAWNNFTTAFQQFAEDPQSASWVDLARINAQQANAFNQLANIAPDVATKHFYRKQAISFGMEAMNSIKASILQADARRRENFAQRRLDRDTIGGQTGEIMSFLTADDPNMTPDFKAAAYIGRYRQMAGLPGFTSAKEMAADPDYQNARQIAHASHIARMAASASLGEGRKAWGTEESRGKGESMAWEAAKSYYGSMPYMQARQEIQTRFAPNYLRSITELNAARPESQRMSAEELQKQTQVAAMLLNSHIYHSQPVAPATAKASHPYSRSSVTGGRFSPAPQAPADEPAAPAEQDSPSVPSRAMLLKGGK